MYMDNFKAFKIIEEARINSLYKAIKWIIGVFISAIVMGYVGHFYMQYANEEEIKFQAKTAIKNQVSQLKTSIEETAVFCNGYKGTPKDRNNSYFSINNLMMINERREEIFDVTLAQVIANKGLISNDAYQSIKMITELANTLFLAGDKVCAISIPSSRQLREMEEDARKKIDQS